MALEFGLSATQKGMVGAASLSGILIGATALGGLSDVFGRRLMFILEMVLFTIFLTLIVFSTGFPSMIACLFGMGLALGCDYPTAHLMISESIPSQYRGRLVLSAFGFQAVGALAGTVFILKSSESLIDWRWMYATAIIPALVVVFGRFFITQSGHWLVAQGRIAEAEREIEKLMRRHPLYPRKVVSSLRRVVPTTSPSLIEVNGWKMFAHPLFIDQVENLVNEVEQLRAADPKGYREKKKTKLLAAILKMAFEVIPRDPADRIFFQGNTLGPAYRHWHRGKFFDGRYRLFFRYSTSAKAIVLASAFLLLGLGAD